MRAFTVANFKGGVGKSSISISLANELSKHGKTILIDTDPQANSGSCLIKSMAYELVDVLENKCLLKDAIIKTDFDNLYCLTSDSHNANLIDYKMTKSSNNPFAFCDIVDELVKLDFDFVVFDTAPSFTAFEEAVFLATNYLIPVLEFDQFSIDGFSIFNLKMQDYYKRRRTQQPTFNICVLNKYNASLSFCKAIKDGIKDLPFKFYIMPTDQNFKKVATELKPIQYLTTKKETLETIKELTEEVIK